MFHIIAAFSAPVLRCNTGDYDSVADAGKPCISAVDTFLNFFFFFKHSVDGSVTVVGPAVKHYIWLDIANSQRQENSAYLWADASEYVNLFTVVSLFTCLKELPAVQKKWTKSLICNDTKSPHRCAGLTTKLVTHTLHIAFQAARDMTFLVRLAQAGIRPPYPDTIYTIVFPLSYTGPHDHALKQQQKNGIASRCAGRQVEGIRQMWKILLSFPGVTDEWWVFGITRDQRRLEE